ncbi:MAG TPA: four helix bundle protein [Terriglobales bacterium]|nr:four helix bundle protein [Terriglobales bacterium]
MSASFKDLRVWQESMKFAVDMYRTTARFPRHELYGLSNQLRRAAVSIPSNIAEGKGHRSDREFGNYLLHARGSLLEVQTQIMIATELQYISGAESQCLLASSDAIGRSLNSLINSLREKVA